VLQLSFEVRKKQVLGFFGGETGYPLQFLTLLCLQLQRLFTNLGDFVFLAGQAPFPFLELLLLPVDVLFLLQDALFLSL